jgi:SsrA-binding protein
MKNYAENKKGRFNYEILEEYEAGIILTGPEVKSIRMGQISLKESFGTISRGEIWLTNAHISPYKQASDQEQEPTRPRKLLISKAEIGKIAGKLQSEGITLIPLRVYDKHGKIKIEIGLARGKKKYDKREKIKKRDLSREMAKDLKERSRN